MWSIWNLQWRVHSLTNMVKTYYEYLFLTSVEQPIGALHLLTLSNTPNKGGSIGLSGRLFLSVMSIIHALSWRHPFKLERSAFAGWIIEYNAIYILYIQAVRQLKAGLTNCEMHRPCKVAYNIWQILWSYSSRQHRWWAFSSEIYVRCIVSL